MIVFTDSEAETSGELKEFNDLNIGENGNFTKSVFNITLDNVSDQHDCLEIKNYENRLQKEIDDWGQLWRKEIQELKRLKEKFPPVDITILSKEKRVYLDAAPCMQKFLRDSLEFRQAAYTYLEVDYAELLQKQQNLVELCDHRLSVAKATAVNKMLAGSAISKTKKSQIHDSNDLKQI